MRLWIGVAALAVIGAANSVYGEQPAEIFAKLAEPAAVAERNIEARAKAIPALAELPADAEGMLAIKVPEEFSPKAEGVDSAAVCIGKGSAQAAKDYSDALTTFAPVSGGDGMLFSALIEPVPGSTEVKDTAKKQLVKEQLAKFLQEKTEIFYQTLEKGSVPVIHAVLTAKPGKEKQFVNRVCASLYRRFQCLPDGAQKVTVQGYSGVRISVFDLIKASVENLRSNVKDVKDANGVQLDETRLHKALDNRYIYLLTKVEKGIAKIVICGKPEQIQFPTSIETSMAASPMADGMDAHVDSVIATAYIPKDLKNDVFSVKKFAEMVLGGELGRDLYRSVFSAMAQRFPQEATQFTAAAAGVDEVYRQFATTGGGVTSDCTLQVWREGKDVWAELAADTEDVYASGELRHLDLAAAPNTWFYAESTSCPSLLPQLNLQKLVGAIADISEGCFLMRDWDEDSVDLTGAPNIRLHRTEYEGVAAGLDRIFAELSAPFTFVVTAEKQEIPNAQGVASGETEIVMIQGGGIQIAVRDQKGLDEGWKQFSENVAPFIGSPILSFLPVQSTTLPDGATVYNIDSPPGMMGGCTPQIIRDNSSVILAADADTARCLHESTGSALPLSGSAFAFKGQPLHCGDAPGFHVDSIYGVCSQRGKHATLRIRISVAPCSPE